jgi:transcription termination factor NusB
VVLAEAGILAERYGGEKSSSFVRGTLSRLAEGLAG